MPTQLEWLRAINLWDFLALTIAVGGVAAGLRWLKPGLLRLLAVIDRVHDVLDDWHGRPEQLDASGAVVRPAEPGILVRLKAVEYNVKPNSGGSAHDGLVRRLEVNAASLTEVRGLVAGLIEAHAAQDERLAALARDYHEALEHNHPDYRRSTYHPINPGYFED